MVGCEFVEPGRAHPQQGHRIAADALEQRGVDAGEQLLGVAVPRPPQIRRQLTERAAIRSGRWARTVNRRRAFTRHDITEVSVAPSSSLLTSRCAVGHYGVNRGDAVTQGLGASGPGAGVGTGSNGNGVVGCRVVSRSTTSRPWSPPASTRPKRLSARSCRYGRRSGARDTKRWRPLWWSATSAAPTPRSATRRPPGSRSVAAERGLTEGQADPVPHVGGPHPGRLPWPVQPRPGRPVDIPGGRLGDSITSWRHAVVAKLDAGQGEQDLDNDLVVGAALLERAATGCPRGPRTAAGRRRGAAPARGSADPRRPALSIR